MPGPTVGGGNYACGNMASGLKCVVCHRPVLAQNRGPVRLIHLKNQHGAPQALTMTA